MDSLFFEAIESFVCACYGKELWQKIFNRAKGILVGGHSGEEIRSCATDHSGQNAASLNYPSNCWALFDVYQDEWFFSLVILAVAELQTTKDAFLESFGCHCLDFLRSGTGRFFSSTFEPFLSFALCSIISFSAILVT